MPNILGQPTVAFHLLPLAGAAAPPGTKKRSRSPLREPSLEQKEELKEGKESSEDQTFQLGCSTKPWKHLRSKGFAGVSTSTMAVRPQSLEKIVPKVFMYVLNRGALNPILYDWSCLSIPRYPDNIVAEVLGADLSLLLYERYVDGCLSQNAVPLPLDRIQGDIQPCSATCVFKLDFVALTLLLQLIDFMRSGVVLLLCQLLNIGLVKPISLLIILRGKALLSFFIAHR